MTRVPGETTKSRPLKNGKVRVLVEADPKKIKAYKESLRKKGVK